MNEYHFHEMRVDSLGRKLMTQDELSEKLGITRNRIQQLEKSPKVIPTSDELKAYCDYFNTTSDYLLGIRKTKSIDENLAMISKSTGLNESSIGTLKAICKYWDENLINVVNYILQNTNAFIDFINNLSLYMHNEYTTPLFHDPQTGQLVDCSFHTATGDGILFGKQEVIDNKGTLGWEARGVSTNILESHALLQLLNIISEWKKNYNPKEGAQK